jgi:hypothetical protein
VKVAFYFSWMVDTPTFHTMSSVPLPGDLVVHGGIVYVVEHRRWVLPQDTDADPCAELFLVKQRARGPNLNKTKKESTTP